MNLNWRRLAIISDIHGEYARLERVVADLKDQGCDRIVCLGDLVEGGDSDEAVVQWIRDNGIECTRGNHDRKNDLGLPLQTQDFLMALPFKVVDDDLLFTHISPRRWQTAVTDSDEAACIFNECKARIVFVGHTHAARLFAVFRDQPSEVIHFDVSMNTAIAVRPDGRYVVCVGAVGASRDKTLGPQYCLYDRVDGALEFREAA